MESPKSVVLLYRRVGLAHVFTACGYPGLYVGCSTLEAAYGLAASCVETHLGEVHGLALSYRVPDIGEGLPARPVRDGTLVVATRVDGPVTRPPRR